MVNQDSTEDNNCLYNEKNYFYEFVHPTLYDNNSENTLVKHFERKETKQLGAKYVIKCRERNYPYELDLVSMNLNIYSTGVGVLVFYLKNRRYDNKEDILKINQFGRRVYPPFINDIVYRNEIAEYIKIEGLMGNYMEDFREYTNKMNNTPSPFVTQLIKEIAENVTIKPVIDDRMFVVSWYKNDTMCEEFKGWKDEDKLLDDRLTKDDNALKLFTTGDYWYRYVYIDNNFKTCQNDAMMSRLVEKSLYERWQKWGTLYGISKYSFVMLTNAGDSEKYLYDYVESIYVRMIELCLVQRASILRFSSEVTSLSHLNTNDKMLSKKISSLYQSYIRFVNQIHFREITAQEQGIEIYKMIYEQMDLKIHIDKLDEEIQELHNHISLRTDRKTNSEMAHLTLVATIFVP